MVGYGSRSYLLLLLLLLFYFHLYGKPGNVRKFDSCQGDVWKLTKSLGVDREKRLLLA